MTKRVYNAYKEESLAIDKKMRYFIFYPPTKALKLIDVSENDTVEDILTSLKQDFGLKYTDNEASGLSIVLNYNGSDLKPKWSFGDLNIPSGAIIRCLTRKQTAADLYIHCGHNKQILKLFDSSITIETTIGRVRQKISDKIGLPLSTFCLESYDGKQRLYDDMKLMHYDIKVHDHIYLKVWQGYEKFINACIRGFTQHFSHDDIIRHYQAQIALHIAAFYGHLDLARLVIEQGARSDRSAGEHPSRQWAIGISVEALPEMRKCPIHVAVERGHIKMVDLFVRRSVLCTQIRDPVQNLLPFELADIYASSAKTKEEKQRFKEIHYFLKDKQFNLRIPLNSTGEYVAKLLSSSTSPTSKPIFVISAFFGHVSLSLYCKIINWYERAREKVWKRTGGRFYLGVPSKRVFPETGLLGYKVLIDGYNNKFEVPAEQLRGARANSANKPDYFDRYIGFSDEERDKIIQTKAYIKQYALDERRRAKQLAAARLQEARRKNTFSTPAPADSNKQPTTPSAYAGEGMTPLLESSTNPFLLSFTASDAKQVKSVVETDNSSSTSLLQSTLVNGNRSDVSHASQEKTKLTSATTQTTFRPVFMHEQVQHTFPVLMPSTAHYNSTNKIELNTHTTSSSKQNPPSVMSSVDAYTLSSHRISLEAGQNKAMRTIELHKQIEQSLQLDSQPKQTTAPLLTQQMSYTAPVERDKMLDLDSHVPLPDRPKSSSLSPIKSRVDLDIRQSTFDVYERYASASVRTTAIDCLQEAAFFKKKTWLKKVEISKDMLKHKVQQRMCRGVDETCRSPVTKSTRNSSTIKIH